MILALDLGTSTGWAAGLGDTLPQVGAVQLPSTGEQIGPFLAAFRDFFVPVATRLEPTIVVFESPILPGPRWNADKKKMETMTNIWTTRKLQGLAGLVELMCLDLGLPCGEVALGTMKKELAGSGAAKKSAMLVVARRLGLDLPEGPEAFDAADAFAAWLVALRTFAPQHSDAWDRRLFGRR